MNANEARRIALQKNTNDTDSQYAEIQKAITDAAKSGLYEIHYNKKIKNDVQRKLTDEGFTVGSPVSDFRDQSVVIKISWLVDVSSDR